MNSLIEYEYEKDSYYIFHGFGCLHADHVLHEAGIRNV